MSGGLFGPSFTAGNPQAGGWMVQTPPNPWAAREEIALRSEEDPLVEWCTNAEAILRREKQEVTEAQTRAMNLYKGGMPWWSQRPRWKIGKRINWTYYASQKWTQVLCDSQSKITYSAFSTRDQRVADIAGAALTQATQDGEWERVKRSAVLNSQIQKKAFLRLTPEITSKGTRAILSVVTGEQLFVDKNATTIDDAEVIMYEHPMSANEIYSRWPHLKEQLERHRYENRGAEGEGRKGEQLSPPTSMALPTGQNVTSPPFTATANPPDNAGATSGMMVKEFWTFPKKTVPIDSVRFTIAGEPATREKYITYADGSEEPLRRVITEGNVIYEWPQSFVEIVKDLETLGGLRIVKEMEAREVVKDAKDYRLYPDGRLSIIVAGERAEDRMNPLGYTPFIEIESNPDTVFWGESVIDIISDAYEYYIRLLCSLLDAANLTSNPIWRFLLSEEISDEDITNAPGAILRETQMSLKYSKREPGPNMPQYVMALLGKIEETIMKLSNLNEIATGQAKFKGQQSAETVGMYQDQAAVSFRDALGSIQRADIRLGKQFLELMTRFYTTPQLISLKNDAGVDEAIPFLGTQFVAPLKVQAKPGTSMPNSPTARLNMAINLIQSGQPLVDLPELWSLMEQVGYIDSASALERRIEKEMLNPKEAWKVPGRPGANTNTKPKGKKASGKRANKT